MQGTPTQLRRAEVLGMLSFAADLGLGQDLGQALTGAVVAGRLATSLGLSEVEASCAYDCAILNLAGCTADPYTFAHYFGDELEAARRLAPVDFSDPREAVPAMVRYVGVSEGLLTRARLLAGMFTVGQERLRQAPLAHCEVAALLVPRVGCGEDVRRGVLQAFERWDGKGRPGRVGGAGLSVPGHIAQFSIEVAVHLSRGGPQPAIEMARRRAAKMFDPSLVDHFVRHAGSLLDGLSAADVWMLAMREEPGARPMLAGAALDEALRALGDFADLKSVYHVGHSAAVAELAAAAAQVLGLPELDRLLVRRAGWLHDLGRVGVPVAVWDKSEPLSRGEMEKVRLHPYHSQRIVGSSPAMAVVAEVVGRHHERLDGSGYPHGFGASQLSTAARILAVADTFQTRTSDRAHRAAYSAEEVAAHVRLEVRAGRLDADVVEAVVSSAGLPARRHATALLGLTPREVEVLRLIATGRTVKQIARVLVISAKTADNHVQHIYTKLGVSTRAAATMLAMQHGIADQS